MSKKYFLLKKFWLKRMLHNDAFVHSGQGAHYTGSTFQKLLKENKLEQSMSIKVAIYLMNYRLW